MGVSVPTKGIKYLPSNLPQQIFNVVEISQFWKEEKKNYIYHQGGENYNWL